MSKLYGYEEYQNTKLENELMQRLDHAFDWFGLAIEMMYGLEVYKKEDFENALEETAHVLGVKFPRVPLQITQTKN